jgi:hypothetical protein
MSLTDRIRAGKPAHAAPVVSPSVLVVSDTVPHGRTVTREPVARARWLTLALAKDLTYAVREDDEGV